MKKLMLIIVTLLLSAILAACTAPGVEKVGSTATTEIESTNLATVDTVETESPVTVTPEIALILADTHEQAEDYSWNTADEFQVTLKGTTASVDAAGVDVNNSTITIHQAGTYRLRGTLTDGQVIVDTEEKETVRLILDNVEITSTTSAPLFIANAEKVIVILAAGSENNLTDGSAYTLADPEENEPNAALFSKADLTIHGSGKLTVNANYLDGINSKDGLLIDSGTIVVNAVDDGIRGKDYLVIKDGNISINTTGDGLKSDEEDDPSLGYIQIEGGSLQVTAGGDAISAQTKVMVNNGMLSLASGGGSSSWLDESLSAKGIKGLVSVEVNGGTINVNAADDAIHSNSDITVNAGTLYLASGDDGIHADTTLTINGGEIEISESYEGIESSVITLNAGNLHINASDDGINVASGVDGSGTRGGWFGDPGGGAPPQPGGQPAGQPGGFGLDAFNASGDYFLYINGGYVVVNADGDGIDVNGSAAMTGGVVLVNGPTESMNGALDYLGTFNISGGTLVAAGSVGMAQGFSESSSQNSLQINFETVLPANTAFHIEEKSGNSVLTFIPVKDYQSIVFSSPDLVTGSDYNLYTGGSAAGEVTDGLATMASYSSGSKYDSFSIDSILTTIGNVFRQGPGGGHRR